MGSVRRPKGGGAATPLNPPLIPQYPNKLTCVDVDHDSQKVGHHFYQVIYQIYQTENNIELYRRPWQRREKHKIQSCHCLHNMNYEITSFKTGLGFCPFAIKSMQYQTSWPRWQTTALPWQPVWTSQIGLGPYAIPPKHEVYMTAEDIMACFSYSVYSATTHLRSFGANLGVTWSRPSIEHLPIFTSRLRNDLYCVGWGVLLLLK